MHYLTIETIPQQGVGNSRIHSMLHSFIHVKLGSKKYAIAFPYAKTGVAPSLGKLLRIFSKKEILEDLQDELEADPRLTIFCKIKRIREVPSSWPGNLVEYRRYQLPSFKTKDPERQEFQAQKRMLGLEKAKKLPFVPMQSFSSKQKFSLFIDKIQHKNTGEELIINTDSYGLSKSSCPTLLPELD